MHGDEIKSVSKFGGILFTPIRLTDVTCFVAGPMKVRLSFRSHNVPPPPPKPLHKHQYISRHLVTVIFPSWLNGCVTACSDYRLLWGALWVETSSLASEVKTLSWPERLSVAYCTHIIQSKVMLKSEISINIDVYGYRRAHRPASCNAGVIFRGCGIVKCNTQPSIY